MSKVKFSFLAVAVAMVALFLGSVAQAGAIGLWQFNEKAAGEQSTGVPGEFIDSSGSGHPGYAWGAPKPFYVAAPAGMDPSSAIALKAYAGTPPNTDSVLVPYGSAFNLNLSAGTDYTIEAMIKIDINSFGAYDRPAIFAKSRMVDGTPPTCTGTTWGTYVWRLTESGTTKGKLSFYYQPVANPGGWWTTANGAVGNTVVANNQWHHVAMVIDTDPSNPNNSKVTMYVDYVADGTTYFKDIKGAGDAAWNNQSAVSTNYVAIGDYWGDGGTTVNNSSQQWTGDISMVRFSDAALTPDQFYGIPEPSTLVLLAAGLIGLLCYAWRKQK